MAQKHSLALDGAPHASDGRTIHADPKVTSGTGRARCSGCGQMSATLPNGASRRRWAKWHKENPGEVDEGGIAPEEGPRNGDTVVVHGVDLAPGTEVKKGDVIGQLPLPEEVIDVGEPEPELDTDDLIGEVDPDDNQDQITISCNFADVALAGIFWGVCGNKGTKVVLAELHPEVAVRANGNPKVFYITGEPDAAQAAADTVRAYWDGAAESFAEYKQTSDEYKNRDQSKASDRRIGYQLTKAFFTDYAEGWAAHNDG